MSAILASGLLEDLGINFKVLGVQVAIFLTTFVVLSRILFARVLDQMRRREEEIRRAHEAIARDRAQVEEMARTYQERLAKIDKQAYEKMQEIYREALAAAARIVSVAQSEARAQVEQARAEIGREKADAQEKLRAEVARLTFDAVERVLESRLDPKVHGPALEKFLAGGKA